jgi:Domain of Unknown Function (DUF349)
MKTHTPMENTSATASFGYAKDGKVYLKGYDEHPERAIGIVRNTEDESVQYFVNRFAIAERKVHTLVQEIETAQNKGSYLTKLLQLRKKLTEFDAIGDFRPLLALLDEQELSLRELILNNQIKNLEIKRALIKDLEAAMVIQTEEDWLAATEAVMEIKNKWLKTGPVDKAFQDDLEQSFMEKNDVFFQQRREYYAEKNRIIDGHINKLRNFVYQARNLAEHHDFDHGIAEFKRLQNEWKLVGPVPVRKGSKLWKKFKRHSDRFYERYNAAKGIVRQRVDPNLMALQAMVAETEELLNDQPNMAKSAERAKELLVKWKAIVGKSRTVDRHLPEKFRLICDKIFELNYLFRVISYRHPALFTKPRIEQLKIMINQMDYMSKKEKSELEMFTADAHQTYRNDMPKEVEKKIEVQNRKITVKEMLLTEFKKELEGLLGLV